MDRKERVKEIYLKYRKYPIDQYDASDFFSEIDALYQPPSDGEVERELDKNVRIASGKLYDIWVQNPDTTERMFAKEEAVRNWLVKSIISLLCPAPQQWTDKPDRAGWRCLRTTY